MGTRENDLFFGGFATVHVNSLSDAQAARFESLLEANDADLFRWISGTAPVPPEHDSDVMRMLMAYTPTDENN